MQIYIQTSKKLKQKSKSKGIKEEKIMFQTLLTNVSLMVLSNASSIDVDLQKVANPIVDLFNSVLTPLIMIVGALGAIWCVLLGVKLAKADEPQEREKARMALKNAIAGYLLIFILVVVLRLTIGPLFNWMQANKTTLGSIAPIISSFYC